MGNYEQGISFFFISSFLELNEFFVGNLTVNKLKAEMEGECDSLGNRNLGFKLQFLLDTTVSISKKASRGQFRVFYDYKSVEIGQNIMCCSVRIQLMKSFRIFKGALDIQSKFDKSTASLIHPCEDQESSTFNVLSKTLILKIFKYS